MRIEDDREELKGWRGRLRDPWLGLGSKVGQVRMEEGAQVARRGAGARLCVGAGGRNSWRFSLALLGFVGDLFIYFSLSGDWLLGAFLKPFVFILFFVCDLLLVYF